MSEGTYRFGWTKLKNLPYVPILVELKETKNDMRNGNSQIASKCKVAEYYLNQNE